MRSPSLRRIGRPKFFAAIVHRLADPDAALVVDVDRGRVDEHRLGGEQFDLQAVGDGEFLPATLRASNCASAMLAGTREMPRSRRDTRFIRGAREFGLVRKRQQDVCLSLLP